MALAADGLAWYAYALLAAGAIGFAVGMFMIAFGVVDYFFVPKFRTWLASNTGLNVRQLERGYADTIADYRERGRGRIKYGAFVAVPSFLLMGLNVILF